MIRNPKVKGKRVRRVYVAGIRCESLKDGWELLQELLGPEVTYWTVYNALRHRKSDIKGVSISTEPPKPPTPHIQPRVPGSGPLIKRIVTEI